MLQIMQANLRLHSTNNTFMKKSGAEAEHFRVVVSFNMVLECLEVYYIYLTGRVRLPFMSLNEQKHKLLQRICSELVF